MKRCSKCGMAIANGWEIKWDGDIFHVHCYQLERAFNQEREVRVRMRERHAKGGCDDRELRDQESV